MKQEEKMIRKQIYLEKEQDEAIKNISSLQGRTESEMIREAISHYVAMNTSTDPLCRLIGSVESDSTDGSVEHDRDIYIEQGERQ